MTSCERAAGPCDDNTGDQTVGLAGACVCVLGKGGGGSLRELQVKQNHSGVPAPRRCQLKTQSSRSRQHLLASPPHLFRIRATSRSWRAAPRRAKCVSQMYGNGRGSHLMDVPKAAEHRRNCAKTKKTKKNKKVRREEGGRGDPREVLISLLCAFTTPGGDITFNH